MTGGGFEPVNHGEHRLPIYSRLHPTALPIRPCKENEANSASLATLGRRLLFLCYAYANANFDVKIYLTPMYYTIFVVFYG